MVIYILIIYFNESYWDYKKNIFKKGATRVKMADTLTVLKYNYDHIKHLLK